MVLNNLKIVPVARRGHERRRAPEHVARAGQQALQQTHCRAAAGDGR